MSTHLTPEQFVDLAEGTRPESALPHLAECEACRGELADLRAMMSETTAPGLDVVPEPSPLFWSHLSSRVRDAVEQEGRPRSWRAWVMRPLVLVPSLAGALAILLAVVLMPRETLAPAPIPSTSFVVASDALPSSSPSLPPLSPYGKADDPQLRVVAAVATAVQWDEMMDEVATATIGTGDAVAGALTVDEQRELQRLLMAEMELPRAPEKRS